MLAGVMVAAPPPAYTMTETTLTDLFPGERLDFTGRLARNGDSAALVRYAITCCRADATPVAVDSPLLHPTSAPANGFGHQAASRTPGTIFAFA